VLSICGNSFKTVGKAFQAKGGYFEESQINKSKYLYHTLLVISEF
jgi:hypothetical protein